MARCAKIYDDLATKPTGMRAERGRLSRHADVGKAMNYMLKRWDAFTRFLDDGRICLTKLVDQPWTIMSIGLRDWAHRF